MIKLFSRMNRTDKGLLLFSVVFVVLQVYFDMRIPEFLSEALKVANNSSASLEQGVVQIRQVAVHMALCVLVSFILSAISSVIIAKAVMNFVTKIRSDIFEKVQSLSVPDVDKFTVHGLITRSTSDVMNIQTFILIGFQALVKAPIISVWALVKIGAYGVSWQLAVLVSLIVVSLFIIIALMIEAPQIRLVQKGKDSLNKSVMEKLSGTDVVRAYNAENHLIHKFESINNSLADALKKSQIPSATVMPGINLTLYLVTIAIYVIAINQINSGQVADQLATVSDIVAFIPYTAQLLLAFILVVQVMMLYQGARVSSKRIDEVLSSKVSITDPDNISKTSENKDNIGVIEFKNVNFGYKGSDTSFINNISFRCEGGSTTAIIGAIGSGKTTMINLLMRYYDVDSGEILVDGINVKDYSLKDLRDKISLTAQKALLFTGTIEENIHFGNDEKSSPYELSYICDTAGAKDFIEENEKKYKAQVLKKGTNFSGGQRQRLSIARCLSKPCEILVFDDSFSALDFKTERIVRKKIMDRFRGVTKIIISQRINTIQDADQIIVMNNGSIVGIGRHAELMENCRDYQEIYASQNKDESLASAVKEECHA